MNFYEVLEITTESSREQIKSAYIVMIRRYPAESHPDRFQMIQQAYQVLSDTEKRKKYDIDSLYGDDIKRLSEEASEYFEDEQYERANRSYAKLLEYLPEDTGFLNRYAMSFSRMGQHDLAIQYYKKAIEHEDSRAAFHYNLALEYMRTEDYSRAIRSYKQAMICDPLDYDIVEALSSLYIDLEDHENAWFIVETAMKKQGMPPELKPIYLQRLVEIAVIIKGTFEMKVALKHAEKFFGEHPKFKNDIMVNMYNFALKLANLNNYKWAIPVIDFVKKYDQNDQQTINLHARIHKEAPLYIEFDELTDDEAIVQEMRLKIYLYLYSDEYEEDDFKEKVKMINDSVYEVCVEYPSAAKSSIRHIESCYPAIAKEMKEWLKILKSVL